MNFTFLSSLFRRKQEVLQLPDSLLIKKLKEISQEHNFLLFENKTIFHHNQTLKIPLFILDPNRGIYLFEYKEWSYDELKNATIEKASKQENSKNSLSFENTHTFVQQKFNELTHKDGVEIFNFLLMENLNIEEYDHLNESFKELLPQQRVMFHDSQKEDILAKLKNVKKASASLPNIPSIIGNLLVQYVIYHENEHNEQKVSLSTQEQRDFIDKQLQANEIIYAPHGMGKTELILLKALYEKLKDPEIKITIIQATTLACDIVKQKLIQYIESAMVSIDTTSIEVLTAIQVVNKHLVKIKKRTCDEELILDEKLFKTSNPLADIIFCDDSDCYEESFIDYLKHIQKKSTLVLVSSLQNETASYTLSDTSFVKKPTIEFFHGNELALSMHILSNLLRTQAPKDILVVSSSLNKEKLCEDLESFIKPKALLLDSSKNLLDIQEDAVLLCSYEDLYGLRAKYIILLDTCQTDPLEVARAKHLADTALFITYQDECEYIKELRNEYKDQKNTPRVESTT